MKINTMLRSLIIPVTCGFLVACSSDDSVPLLPPIGDISGTWHITETASSSTPTCNNYLAYDLGVTQNTNAVTVTDDQGNVFNGTLSGDTLTWTGSYPEGSGTTTITSMTATISSDCQNLTSKSTWSYVEPGFSCTGTSTASGYKTSGNTTGC